MAKSRRKAKPPRKASRPRRRITTARRGKRPGSKKRAPKKPLRVKPKAAAKAPAPPPPRPSPGSFAWHELASTDVARSRDFYARLFKWKSREVEMMPGFMYTIFKHKGQDIAGMMAILPEQGDMRPRWDLYVAVRDVDATAQQAETLGGEIMIPPHDIPVGRWAMLKDPSGAMIAIYKAKRT